MMSERRVDQAALFYEFSLDRRAPLAPCCGPSIAS